jgi:hypothetical protein
MIVPSGMVSLTYWAFIQLSPEPTGPGAVGGAKVGTSVDVDAASVASGADVRLAFVGRGVAVAWAISVSCADTVISTAVAIESDSAPPQEVNSNAKSMRMDRKLYLWFLFILCPFGKYKDLPADYYTAWRLKSTHEKSAQKYRALL